MRTERVCRELGVAPGDGAIALLEGWLDALRSWNRKIDLTAARGDDEFTDLMLADAALLSLHLPHPPDDPGAPAAPVRVVDVGTGAGAPGLALAILRPDLRMCLVEPLQKRVAFLRFVCGKLGLEAPRVEVVAGRAEGLGARRFDVAVSRATLAPEAWLALGATLAPEVWVLLAREAPPEAPGMRLVDDLGYRWPLTGAVRRAVRYRSTAA
ncbi:MAG: class I SAM-dependent methyltransferase [Polyangiaceae bacterium]|nr:class I SAM-dependent methyltransferase [Polyangiaceae bacterium]